MTNGDERASRTRRLREYGLTAGELGAVAGQTAMVALLPVLLAERTDSTLAIGAVIGAEGVFALLVPYVVGRASDRLGAGVARRLGRRNVFLLASAPVMAVALVAAPFLDSFLAMAGAAFLYFAGLHGFLTPLRALVADSVPEDRRGRVQGVLGAFHAGGLGFGLVAGGFLMAAWTPLPFIVAAVLLLATTGATFAATPRSSAEREAAPGRTEDDEKEEDDDGAGYWRELARDPTTRSFLAANALWSAAVDGIRPFIFLFATAVIGVSLKGASGLLTFLFAGVAVGSVLTGRLGDRFGKSRVLLLGTLVTGVAMLAATLIRQPWTAGLLLLPVGLGAATLISLPYPVFAELVDPGARGRATGIYTMSIGVARILGPLVVAGAIELSRPVMPDTEGYPAMWLVAGAMGLLGAWFLRRSDKAG